MSDKKESSLGKDTDAESKSSSDLVDNPCADIKDPVRRALCRVCQAPVIGEAPFCKDHEPPVP